MQSELFYWDRQKPNSSAEVDYVININDRIIPIEIKAGKTGSLRSLQLFLNEKNYNLGIRLSQKPLELNHRVLSVPLYMIAEIPRLIACL
jgi:predicted AAA+ superfamily ATPase